MTTFTETLVTASCDRLTTAVLHGDAGQSRLREPIRLHHASGADFMFITPICV